MSGCPMGRLFGRSVSDRRCHPRGRSRKTDLAGIGQKLDHHSAATLPVQSLPGLFSAAPFPVSLLIPSGFLLPLRIEMLIKSMADSFHRPWRPATAPCILRETSTQTLQDFPIRWNSRPAIVHPEKSKEF